MLDYVGYIDQPQNSEAVHYLKKSLRELGKHHNLPGQPVQQNGHSSVLTESGNKEPSPVIQSPQKQNQQVKYCIQYFFLNNVFFAVRCFFQIRFPIGLALKLYSRVVAGDRPHTKDSGSIG